MAFRVYNPYVTAFIATIGGMMFGFDIASVSSFIGEDGYREHFDYPDSLTQGGITSAMPGGSFIGALCSGYFSDKFGRKPVIQMSSIIWMVGAAIQASSINQAQLICGRFIGGWAIGLASSQVPVYIAELSPKNIRGRLVGIFQWAITWGIMIMFYIGYGCTHMSYPAAFQTAWGLQMVPGFLLLLGTFVLSESPRWLAKEDRWEEAIEIISKVQGGGDVNHPQVLVEVEEIKEVIRIERQSKSVAVFLSLFKKDSINRTMVGVWGQIWQQLCGMNVMMYYIVFIFYMAGFEGNAALVSSSIQYVINMVMTVPALLFIDKWGRRPLFIFGGLLMTLWLVIMAILLGVFSDPVDQVQNNPDIKILIPKTHASASKAVIACSYLFVATFAPTWGPGMWIYCSEIFPLNQRATANGLCAGANWIFNWALALFVPPAFRNITWKTYVMFAVFCFAMTVHVFFLFPETKGKTLEEINQIWEENIPAWRTASFEPRKPSVTEIKEAGGIHAISEKFHHQVHEDDQVEPTISPHDNSTTQEQQRTNNDDSAV